MTIRDYNSIVNSEVYSDTELSIGFRRMHLLPQKVRLNMFTAYCLNHGTHDNVIPEHNEYVKSFFHNMTEEEYKQYIITH